MLETNVSIWPVIVCGVATFFLGGLWYGPLFGDVWLQAHGLQDQKIPPVTFLVGALSYLALAVTLALVTHWVGNPTWIKGAILGLVLWAGIPFALGLNIALFSGKPLVAFWIDSVYQLIAFVGIGVVLAVWR